MKKLRNIILAGFVLVGFVSTVAIAVFVQQRTTAVVFEAECQHAKDLLSAVYLAVDNEYRSLQFYRESAITRRKESLRDIVSLGIAVLEKHYQSYVTGKVTEEQARKAAIEALRVLRYQNDVGYVWINSTDSEQPVMLMHPVFPDLEGKASDPRYADALENGENLLTEFVRVGLEHNSGYLEYQWPKPSAGGTTSKQPKLSYVRVFPEWGWIVGSGVYVDDIEADVDLRLQAILRELKDTFSQVKIAEHGYMFLFTGDRTFVVHPRYEGTPNAELLNPQTQTPIMDELIASMENGGVHEYIWDKPPEHLGDFRFKKRTYVRHFPPLDWYIAASLYDADIAAPANELRNSVLLISALFFLGAIVVAWRLSKIITRPLTELTAAANAINEQNIHEADIPVSGTHEVRELGEVLRRIMRSLSAGVREKEVLLQRVEDKNDELAISNLKLREQMNERQQAQGELVSFRNYLQDIIDSMPSTLIGINPDGVVTQWNLVAERKTGLCPEEAMGHILSEVYPALAAEILRVCGSYSGNLPFEKQKIPRQADGEVFYENITVYPLKSVGDAVIRVDDVTTLVRIEEMMLQTEKMLSLGGLAAGMAHEINNPLGGILQGVQNIKRRLSPDLAANQKAADEHGVSIEAMTGYLADRKIIHMLDGVVSSAERAAGIVRDMLEFSRKSDKSMAYCDMAELIDKTIELASKDYDLKKKYDFRQIDIQREYEDGLPAVRCAYSEIEQVLLNLFRNAAQAMAEMEHDAAYQAQLTVHLKADGEYVAIVVKDKGPGIPQETLKRVFEPFFTTKPKGIGTGLGLSVSYFIVTQNHGGTFHVDSVVGEGTSFTLRLPVDGKIEG